MDADVDVLVIGGGIQGLLALEALRNRGYAAALVTAGDLGEGQTIHSHGFLNTGFGMMGTALADASRDVVQPYLRDHGIEPTGEWRVVPPPGFSSPAPAAPLGSGFDESLGARAVASPDRNFPKRRLIEAIVGAHGDSVVPGRASLGALDDGVRTVSIQSPNGDVVSIGARAVVVAAGCGAKRVLEDIVGRTAQVDEIKHRRVHMICVRAAHGALPATSVMVMPLGLMLAAHDDGATVTWYVTPMEFGGPSFDDVPRDAASVEDPEMIARGFHSLVQLYPGLRDATDVRIGSYAGYRQDVGDMPGHALCEPLVGAEDVVVALPSGLVTPWINVARIVTIVGERVTPSERHPQLATAASRTGISRAVEDRPGFVWHSVDEFARRVREGQAASSSSAT